MATFVHGKEGKVTINGTVLNVTNWTLESETELADVSHSGSNCQRLYIAGLIDAGGEISMVWDSDAKPTSPPPDLTPGTALTSMELELGDSGESIDIATAIVESVSVATGTGSEITFNATWKKNSTTAVTYP